MILHCKNAEMTIIKKNNKNCMILHCKNAEMILSFLHFYSVKLYNFFIYFFEYLIFFLNLAVYYIRENKKSQKYFFFFSKMQKFGSVDP